MPLHLNWPSLGHPTHTSPNDPTITALHEIQARCRCMDGVLSSFVHTVLQRGRWSKTTPKPRLDYDDILSKEYEEELKTEARRVIVLSRALVGDLEGLAEALDRAAGDDLGQEK